LAVPVLTVRMLSRLGANGTLHHTCHQLKEWWRYASLIGNEVKWSF
jgi:hypothetical protein